MCSFLLDIQSLARWHLRHVATFVGTSDLRHEGAYRNATSAVYEEYLRLIDPHGSGEARGGNSRFFRVPTSATPSRVRPPTCRANGHKEKHCAQTKSSQIYVRGPTFCNFGSVRE